MAGYSARQSSYSDGDTITAAHTNDEFNQILAAFNVSTGHTHDGSTAGDGGPISKLFSNAITFGTGADTDIAITFDGNTSDGVLTWMEDEDYFQFSDDILLTTTEKLQFRDTAIYINSSTDGQLDLVADSEIQIAATTIDINGNVDVSGTLTVAGAVDFGDAALSNVGAVQLDSIAGDGDTNTSITFSGSDVITITAGGDAQFTFNNGSIVPSVDDDIDLGTSSLEFKDAFFDGTVTTDALVADTADINGGTVDGAIIGGSSAAAITGTAITGTSFVIGSANISEAELETIDGVTAGTVAASKAVVVDSNKDIGSFRNITLTGELDAGSLDVSGDADIDGTLETDALSINGTAVTSTAAELNLVDGITAGTVSASLAVIADSNKDVTGFRNITLTGELDAGSLDISGDADIDGTLEADAITIGGVTLAETISDTVGAMVSSNTETNITVSYDDSDNTLDFVIGTLNQDTTGTAANATHVTVTDNESTNEENLIPFIEDASATGNVGLESDGDFAYNPSTGTVSATIFKGNIDAVDGDFDGTLEADAITIGGVTLAETISDTVGAMVSSNTETGISVTYDDSDNTLDFVIGAGAIVNSMLADDAVGADELAANAVVTASIVDDNVTQAKIADNAVGADQLAANAVVNASIASSAAIADSKLATISTADKVSAAAIQVDGATDGTGITIADADKLIVDDAGATKYVNASQLKTYASGDGASKGFAVAMAIAL
jgi:cytoskeletal protein CcmA (bactofilin family)